MRNLVAGLLGTTLLLVACTPAAPTGAPDPGQTTQQERRAENQVVRLGVSNFYQYLTPQASTVYNYNIWPMYDNLTQFGPKFEVKPSVATSWKLSDDMLTWTFNLRDDLTFSNGDKLTADDVVFSLKLIQEKSWGQRSYFSTLDTVTAPDAKTVLIKTKTPDVSVPNSGHFLMILPKKYYESVGDDGFREKPVGSGPYELVKFTPDDQTHYKMRSTPHPFRKPANTELVIKFIPETSQLINGLLTDQYDLVLGGSLSGDHIESLKRNGMMIINKPGSAMNYRMPQGTYESKNTALKDKRVRLALNYALNREQIVKQIFSGYGRPSGQYLVPDSPSWNEAIPAFPYDQAKAKQLLAEAGYANGLKIQIQWNPAGTPQDIILAIQADFKAVGVELESIQLEAATFSDYAAGRNNTVKADIFAASLAESNGLSQFSTIGCNKPVGSAPAANYFCIPEAERLNAQVLQESDPVKRNALLQQISKVIADEVVELSIMVRDAIFVATPKTKGFNPPLFNHYNLDEIYKIQ